MWLQYYDEGEGSHRDGKMKARRKFKLVRVPALIKLAKCEVRACSSLLGHTLEGSGSVSSTLRDLSIITMWPHTNSSFL